MTGFKPVKRMMDSKNQYVHRFGHYIAYLLQYRTMMESMVSKELKGKFKYTALGYFWHLLNPLSQIVIYYFIFTVIFGKDIPNYWVYISTGMFAFTFINSCITGGCNIIVSNKNMVTKMAFARETLIFSKVLSGLVTLTISYVILAVLMLITGTGPTWCIVFIPILAICMAVFCTGIAFILSAATVYLRDIANAVGIIMGCMMFAIPIFYVASQRATPLMETIWSINPLYYYIECIHDVFYAGVVPDMMYMVVCIIVAPIVFVIGLFVFKKLERGFAERL
ncbi:ABC transporter permease [Methanomethylophilus alvi]|uniref:ABC transporter permease n=1 Tax=Methanomethylophilus alvi TaxID=1291540 RepID=UPI0037DC4111